MKPTEKQIIEIAGELDIGMKCYYHIKTGEMKPIPDFDDIFGVTGEDGWDRELEEIEAKIDEYVLFEKMESRETFQIMADFAELVEDVKLQEKLIRALNNRKPFRNFKDYVEYSDYRQRWFDYRDKRNIEWLRRQVEAKFNHE